jgi:fructoselysine-6-P-deglycase FrlB-like protein
VSILAMEREMTTQSVDLKLFAEEMRNVSIPSLKPSELIFAGSGDSYATALFARELTGGLARAEDPYEALTHPSLVKGKTLVIISVSGRTKTNILLAKRARGKARKTIAIMADPTSLLAKASDSPIILHYRRVDTFTAGTTSFTASLVAITRLLGKPLGKLDLAPLFKKSWLWARKLQLSQEGFSLFVGTGPDRALAEYGACKVQEVLGSKASAQTPEQVGHAQLFSLNPSSDLLVYVNSGRVRKVDALARATAREGFRVITIPMMGKSQLEKSIATGFCLQNLVLQAAKSRHQTEVAFLRDKKRLLLSDKLIY